MVTAAVQQDRAAVPLPPHCHGARETSRNPHTASPVHPCLTHWKIKHEEVCSLVLEEEPYRDCKHMEKTKRHNVLLCKTLCVTPAAKGNSAAYPQLLYSCFVKMRRAPIT